MGKIAKKALAYAIGKIGYGYSQDPTLRMTTKYDCSSLVYRAYLDAGYKFTTGKTSTTEVNDTSFDLLWPSSRSVLGKQFTSIAALKKQGYAPQPGDVVYICTDIKTARSNKITHVVLVENDTGIVHARGTAYGVRRDPIDHYDKVYGDRIVAVTRFKEDDDLKADDEPTMIYPRAAVCTGDDVNIRETPNGKVLTSVNKNHPLVVQGKDGDSWLTVATLNGEKAIGGYIFAEYVSN